MVKFTLTNQLAIYFNLSSVDYFKVLYIDSKAYSIVERTMNSIIVINVVTPPLPQFTLPLVDDMKIHPSIMESGSPSFTLDEVNWSTTPLGTWAKELQGL